MSGASVQPPRGRTPSRTMSASGSAARSSARACRTLASAGSVQRLSGDVAFDRKSMRGGAARLMTRLNLRRAHAPSQARFRSPWPVHRGQSCSDEDQRVRTQGTLGGVSSALLCCQPPSDRKRPCSARSPETANDGRGAATHGIYAGAAGAPCTGWGCQAARQGGRAPSARAPPDSLGRLYAERAH